MKRTDANQTAIVRALRGVGASVQSLAALGKGCPDLLIGFQGRNHLFEIKDGAKSPSRRQLTPDELEWHQTWRGAVQTIESVPAALTALGCVPHYHGAD